MPRDSSRGGHANIELKQCLIALGGSFEVVLKDGKEEKRIWLNKPNKGVLISSGIWRELENFSSGAVCLVLNSGAFKEEDYIRDFQDFLNSKS